MTANSVLFGSALHLTQNYIYRARMLIKAPGLVATEGKVRSALEGQGFAEVIFFDKSSLPPDWPMDQGEDVSGAFSWTAYLQGRFTLTDRLIRLAELPGTVEVEDMWVYLVPKSATQSMPVTDVAAQPSLVVPAAPSPSLGDTSKLLASASGLAAGLWLGRSFFRGWR